MKAFSPSITKFFSKITFLLILAILPLSLIGQSSSLIDHLEKLQKEVGEVENDKKSYSQELKYDSEKPYSIELLTIETDKKGKAVEKKLILNLGFMDKNLVRRENTKDLMWISAKSGKNPIIKTFTDGIQVDYGNAVEIYCKDVDHSRRIEEILKAAIPLAEKEWQSSISMPQDLDGLKNWLQQVVGNLAEGEIVMKQSLSFDGHNGLASLTLEESDSKGLKKSEKFEFDLADLNERAIDLKIRRKTVSVEISTIQNLDYIKTEEGGIVKKYGKSLSIYFDDIDKAQLTIRGLGELIPKAKKASEQLLVTPASYNEGVESLSKLIKSFTVNDEYYEQTLSPGALSTYKQTVTDKKGGAEHLLSFDFGDLNAHSLAIKPVKHHIVVETTVADKQSLIEVIKDGEQQNYSNQIKFYMSDLPSAKQFMHTLKYVIQNSPKEVETKDFEWLTTSFSNFEERKLELKQTIERREGENCKISYTTLKESPKKIDEHVIEFNLYDIDPDKLSLIVKGKKVEVSLTTNFGESIIKDYENGGKISYIKQVSFLVPDILTGKTMMATLKEAVQDCSKK